MKSGKRYRLRPGVYGILERDGLVLLTHQAEPIPELQLPGGGVDPGEQPVAALHREVYEETGWTMRCRKRLGAFRRFTYMPDYDIWAEKLCAVYLCRPGRRIGAVPEPHHMPVWLPVRDAAETLGNAGDRLFLRRLLA